VVTVGMEAPSRVWCSIQPCKRAGGALKAYFSSFSDSEGLSDVAITKSLRNDRYREAVAEIKRAKGTDEMNLFILDVYVRH
jgi:hypothetical protein